MLQALGTLVDVEGVRFGRRVAVLVPLLNASLKKAVQSMEADVELSQHDESASCVPGWQEVYACLLLLERLAITVPAQVYFAVCFRKVVCVTFIVGLVGNTLEC